MKRRNSRENAFLAQFELSFDQTNLDELLETVRENDEYGLDAFAEQLLRLSIAEMLYGEPDMDSVIVNEAVELAKKYAGEKDYQFVNGVLGTVSRQLHPAKEEA